MRGIGNEGADPGLNLRQPTADTGRARAHRTRQISRQRIVATCVEKNDVGLAFAIELHLAQNEIEADSFEVEVALRLQPGVNGKKVVASGDPEAMAPVNPAFASLNLAQAALLMSYEWMKRAGHGTLGRVTTYEQPVEAGLRLRGSQPAGREELIGFFEHLERELDTTGFFSSPEKRPSMNSTAAVKK